MASSISRRARRDARAIVGAVAAAAALASAGPARAEAPPASEAARSAARAKLVEGVDALGRGEHRLALEKFEAAYALVPSPKIHYDFGLAYLGLGRRAEALSAFERFLAEAQDAPADKREKAAQRTAALRPQVGAADRHRRGRARRRHHRRRRARGGPRAARPAGLPRPGTARDRRPTPGQAAPAPSSRSTSAPGATVEVVLRIDARSPRPAQRLPIPSPRAAAFADAAVVPAQRGAGFGRGAPPTRAESPRSRSAPPASRCSAPA